MLWEEEYRMITDITEVVMSELNKNYDIKSFDELLDSTGFSPVELASAIGTLTAAGKLQIRVNCTLDFPLNGSSRGELLFMKFRKLVSIHFLQHRDVGFYASVLCVSPKYLSSSVKTISGRTAREWISDTVIAEMKYQLTNTTLTIKEIAYKLNFSNISFFGKYFKAQTGMSPTFFRRLT